MRYFIFYSPPSNLHQVQLLEQRPQRQDTQTGNTIPYLDSVTSNVGIGEQEGTIRIHFEGIFRNGMWLGASPQPLAESHVASLQSFLMPKMPGETLA